mmetsp:Transcript_18953/g.48861  ORF Transcript_18953/g.48861 Transcript_18953/m.48861 type:complete len:233 (-) Transcript_18953:355-1053(-)
MSPGSRHQSKGVGCSYLRAWCISAVNRGVRSVHQFSAGGRVALSARRRSSLRRSCSARSTARYISYDSKSVAPPASSGTAPVGAWRDRAWSCDERFAAPAAALAGRRTPRVRCCAARSFAREDGELSSSSRSREWCSPEYTTSNGSTRYGSGLSSCLRSARRSCSSCSAAAMGDVLPSASRRPISGAGSVSPARDSWRGGEGAPALSSRVSPSLLAAAASRLAALSSDWSVS